MLGQRVAVGLLLLALAHALQPFSAAQVGPYSVGQTPSLTQSPQAGSPAYAPRAYDAQQAMYQAPVAAQSPAATPGYVPATPLPPRKTASPSTSAPGSSLTQAPAKPGSASSLVTLGGSLAVVLGLFLIVAWLLKKATPGNSALLPKEVFEVLGRAPLASRQQVHLVRCGRKLLLLSASPAGLETLAEIDDPAEVDRLAGLCAQLHPGSATAAFRHVFQQFSAPAPSSADRLGARHA